MKFDKFIYFETKLFYNSFFIDFFDSFSLKHFLSSYFSIKSSHKYLVKLKFLLHIVLSLNHTINESKFNKSKKKRKYLSRLYRFFQIHYFNIWTIP